MENQSSDGENSQAQDKPAILDKPNITQEVLVIEYKKLVNEEKFYIEYAYNRQQFYLTILTAEIGLLALLFNQVPFQSLAFYTGLSILDVISSVMKNPTIAEKFV